MDAGGDWQIAVFRSEIDRLFQNRVPTINTNKSAAKTRVRAAGCRDFILLFAWIVARDASSILCSFEIRITIGHPNKRTCARNRLQFADVPVHCLLAFRRSVEGSLAL